MKLRFFSIPAVAPEEAEQTLNAFLGAHRVLRCERHFVADGGQSYWALCVETLDGPAPSGSKVGRGERIDYREVLSEADFAVFVRLRDLRKTLAEEAGVPPFAVLTNEQLAAVVTRKVATQQDLAAIEGIGAARLERYGKLILEELGRARGAS